MQCEKGLAPYPYTNSYYRDLAKRALMDQNNQ